MWLEYAILRWYHWTRFLSTTQKRRHFMFFFLFIFMFLVTSDNKDPCEDDPPSTRDSSPSEGILFTNIFVLPLLSFLNANLFNHLILASLATPKVTWASSPLSSQFTGTQFTTFLCTSPVSLGTSLLSS